MVVGNDRNAFFAGEPRGVRPSCGLPIVFAFFLWNPGRQRLVQIIGQRKDVGLVHLAKLGEFAIRLFPVMKFHAVLGKDIPDFSQAPSMPTMASAQVSRIAVSEAIHDWLSCCERK